jgi:hypothetical protein
MSLGLWGGVPDDEDESARYRSIDPSDWGLPNWQDQCSYGDTKQWGKDRWRWEFFRRRTDLREHFDEWAHPTEIHNCFDQVYGDEIAGNKFGYNPLPNPRISDHEQSLLKPKEDDGVSGYFVGYQKPTATVSNLLKWAKVTLSSQQEDRLREYLECMFVHLFQKAMLIEFNLDKPIESQLAQAKELLLVSQKERHKKPLERRKMRGKWLTYLRVLDAREAGASWGQIACICSNTNQTPQTARDTWRQATALCFNFPV